MSKQRLSRQVLAFGRQFALVIWALLIVLADDLFDAEHFRQAVRAGATIPALFRYALRQKASGGVDDLLLIVLADLTLRVTSWIDRTGDF